MTVAQIAREYAAQYPHLGNAEIAALIIQDKPELTGSFEAIMRALQRNKQAQGFTEPQPKEEGNYEEKGDSATWSFPSTARIKSLEDLVRECSIDLSVWEVERFVCNKWEVGAKDAQLQVQVTPLFQVKAWLKKNKQGAQNKAFREQLAKDMKAHAVSYPPLKYNLNLEGCLLEIDIPDLHLGKLTWAEETGDNYNLQIAEQRFLNSIRQIVALSSGFPINRILLPIGNDFFNSDTIHNTTTGGTPQDEDTRWQKTYRRGRQLVVKAIDMLQPIAPVDVVMVPGNHDFERNFYLGDSLECWYRDCQNVTIDNSASPRKYYRYGTTLIGLTHGDKEKIEALYGMLTTEAKQLWAETEFHEFHLGHIHRKKEIISEYHGMVTRFMRSLSGTDAWHHSKAFKGNLKGAECFLYHPEAGHIGGFNAALSSTQSQAA